MKTIAALLIALTLSTPVSAAQRIMIDWGGRLDVYIERYNQWRRTGELVVVDGTCISACTLVVGLIAPERVCATPYARLAFHSASYSDRQGNRVFAREGTRIVWFIYPPHVRALLLRRGWQEGMEHEELIFFEGDELHSIIRPCTADDLAELKGK